ncbi:MAG: hypothetical protein HGA67_00965 [Candidatus Yonathbacteria bacterium]|nr:hypothetical protein [Candidatus Yonathbacteria bacterium]
MDTASFFLKSTLSWTQDDREGLQEMLRKKFPDKKIFIEEPEHGTKVLAVRGIEPTCEVYDLLTNVCATNFYIILPNGTEFPNGR